MSTDSAGRVRPHKSRDLWHLPEVIAVRSQHVIYSPPHRRTIAGKDHSLSEAVEIAVETSEPFEIRALGPALFVGEVALTEAIGEHATLVRFIAPEPELLENGAPISIAWNSPGATRKTTHFHYQRPTRDR